MLCCVLSETDASWAAFFLDSIGTMTLLIYLHAAFVEVLALWIVNMFLPPSLLMITPISAHFIAAASCWLLFSAHVQLSSIALWWILLPWSWVSFYSKTMSLVAVFLSLMFNCAQRLVDERNAEAFYLIGYKKCQAYTNPAQWQHSTDSPRVWSIRIPLDVAIKLKLMSAPNCV